MRARERLSVNGVILVGAGVMQANDREIEALARNIVVVATYWLSFDRALAVSEDGEGDALARGVYQVMSLVAPFLETDSREMLAELAGRYLN